MSDNIYKERWRAELADPAVQEKREAVGWAEQEMVDCVHVSEVGLWRFIKDLLEEQSYDEYLTDQLGGPEGEAAYVQHMVESQYSGPHKGDLYRVNNKELVMYRHHVTINQFQDPTSAWKAEVVGGQDNGEETIVCEFYGDKAELVECRHGLDELDQRNLYADAIPYEV